MKKSWNLKIGFINLTIGVYLVIEIKLRENISTQIEMVFGTIKE